MKKLCVTNLWLKLRTSDDEKSDAVVMLRMVLPILGGGLEDQSPSWHHHPCAARKWAQ